MKINIDAILTLLDRHYGTDGRCFLSHEGAWQLLAATILSAQCTDERVNATTPVLFARYPGVFALASADAADLAALIRPVGLHHHKAKNIIACFQLIRDRHGGEVPRAIEALTALPGVGRKTANVVRGHIFGDPAIVVDTHVARVSKRLGFTAASDPVKVEFDLMEILPEKHWIRYNIQIISHGRAVCTARRPYCEKCFLSGHCSSSLY